MLFDAHNFLYIGFISLQGEILDSESRGKGKNNGKAKAKGRQPRRKTTQKPLFTFVGASAVSQAYKDYFDPDYEVEKRVLGLSDLVSDLAMVLAPF